MSSPKLKLRPKEQLLKTMEKSIAWSSWNSDAATSCDNASPGLLCGEIFVTRSARKWTFICTFCNKGTRDIGEFVCHIKLKHLTHADDDDYDSTDREETTLTTDGVSNEGHEKSQERDFFDYGNYLDVSVHIEADDISDSKNKFKKNRKLSEDIYVNKEQHVPTNAKAEERNFLTKSLNENVGDRAANAVNKNDDINLQKHKYKKLRSNYIAREGTLENVVKSELSLEIDGSNVVNDNGADIEITGEGSDLQIASTATSLPSKAHVNTPSKDGSGVLVKRNRKQIRGPAYCQLCNKTFQYYCLYRNHMIKHSNYTPYMCQLCKKRFKSRQAIRYHMNTHSREKKVHQCSLCSVSFSTENQLVVHVLDHKSDSGFPCKVCGEIINSNEARELHSRRHTEERPFGCDVCKKRFRLRHHLIHHLKLHCLYRCEFCKEEFSTSQPSQRPYTCPQCEKSTDLHGKVKKRKAIFNKPVEIKNPLKLYKNTMASQLQSTEFASLGEMVTDDEERSESNDLLAANDNKRKKRAACKYCPRSYTHTGTLNHHVRQKHPDVL
uniref:C2H2-type domain-containing protein n=1 Tax=Glossina austeni TaxID=7395 RepID=A0A1A9VWR9_GLOAU